MPFVRATSNANAIARCPAFTLPSSVVSFWSPRTITSSSAKPSDEPTAVRSSAIFRASSAPTPKFASVPVSPNSA